jgi:peptide chain release factor 1
MYARYAKRQKWYCRSVGDGVLAIQGDRQHHPVYGPLKWETGLHQAEYYGPDRQSVTAAVAVMPAIEPEEWPIDPQDLEVTIVPRRTGDSGRSHLPIYRTAIQVFHRPTRIRLYCDQAPSPAQNEVAALQILRAQLWCRSGPEAMAAPGAAGQSLG